MKEAANPIRNRRISNARQRKQQHVLDVTIRESKERARRFRLVASWVCKVVLFAAVAGGIWFGGQEGLRRFVWENPDYFIHEVAVTCDGALTREQVLTASGIYEGLNIFTIKLANARAEIEKLPQVESAEVQRVLPDRVAINVTERRPVAWVTLKANEDATSSEHSFLIDARSRVMRSRVMLPEYYHLPIISGVETANLAAGQRVATLEMQAALELVRATADNTRFQVRNIDLAKGYCLVVTDQKRAKITFGLDRIDEQLARLLKLLDLIQPTQKEVQTVNLIPERNIPVTFAEPEPEPVESLLPPAKPDAKGKPPAPPTIPKSKIDAPLTKPAETPAPTRRNEHPAPGKGRRSPVEHLKKHFKLNG